MTGVGTMKFLGLSNYIELFTKDRYFPKALMNSLVLAGASIFIQIPLSLLLAIILARGIKGEKAFRTIYFVPVVISSMVIGQLWMKIFNSQYGLLNIVVGFITGQKFEYSWLSTPATAFNCHRDTGSMAVYRISYVNLLCRY
jgi:raffinose/stachyose/melibiose transport system permease protein